MKTTHAVLILGALIFTACDLPAQRGLFGLDSAEQQAADEAAAAAKDVPDEEEEFKLNDQYSQEDLDAVSKFVTIRVATDAVEKSIAKHPKQGIKTGSLNNGISLMTSANSAYWYKDKTLYSVNPFARAYSPELPHAPSDITEDEIRESTELSDDADDAQKLSSSAKEQFSEFVGLIEYINAALLEDDESATLYTYDFLFDLPKSMSPLPGLVQELETIEKFRELFSTVAKKHPETYGELNIAQSLTIYTFGRVAEDMSHEQVKLILGASDDLLEEAQKGNDTIALYAWSTDGVSNMYAFFRNDQLFEKVIAGYN